MQTQSENNTKHRLQWIDAMRGFTMILVVAYHVMTRCFLVKADQSSSMIFLMLFRMPLFFFISGFLAYKAQAIWNGSYFGNMLAKKVRIQIIPTVVFFLISCIFLSGHDKWWYMVKMLQQSSKGGYWFCLVLLYMFIIYYSFEYIMHRFKVKSNIPLFLLWAFSIMVGVTCYLPNEFSYALIADGKPTTNNWLAYTSVIQLMQYFQFFILGNLVHRFWCIFNKMFDKSSLVLIVIAIAFLSSVDYIKLHYLAGEYKVITRILSMYSLLIVVFIFFRNYQSSFVKEKHLGSILQYIGTRTLDIYLLHFLFIPLLPEIGKFMMSHHGNFVLEVTVSIIFSMVVIGFCIIASNILRMSPLLKKYLFGRNQTNHS